MRLINRFLAVLAIASTLLLSFAAVAQDTSSSSDIERMETYGNCTVYDDVNMLTDRVMHVLKCSESTFTDMTEVAFFARDDGVLAVALSKGVLFHLEDRIDVAVRVDRGELRTGAWRFDVGTNYAMSNDTNLFNTLLNEVANGERIAMQVGEESGNVRLTGSREAVLDFGARADTIVIHED